MRTLLLADDSITVQRVIALIFAKEPVQVVAVSDGRQAIDTITAQKPDIILLGTSLPHVDGYDVAKQVRERPEFQQTPVLLLTGAFETVDEARLKSSGANGVLEKPVEPTVVIRRVKELLGFKSDVPASPAAGRLVTAAGSPADKNLPPSVTSTHPSPSTWEELRDQSLEANAPSVQASTAQASTARGADYRDALDAAFDSLDDQLSGQAQPPTPADGPPAAAVTPPAGSPVFEVDAEWFASEDRPREAAGQEIVEDLQAPELQRPDKAATAPIFEVDDSWFPEGDQARAAKDVEAQTLAESMGVSDFTLPPVAEPLEATPAVAESAPAVIEPQAIVETPAVVEVPLGVAPPVEASPALADTLLLPVEPAAILELVTPPVAISPDAVVAVEPPIEAIVPPYEPAALRDVADDFAALLAFEQGGPQPVFAMPPEPPPAPPAEPVALAPPAEPAASPAVGAPVVTEEMLDGIAERVAARLNSSLGEQWRDVMAAAVRETVRTVVLETSERLVREEIDRIKNKQA